jgi:hypothetical protein
MHSLEQAQESCAVNFEGELHNEPDLVSVPVVIVNRSLDKRACRAANSPKTSSTRRLVDPTTTEKDYSAAELEFMHAMHEYKQNSGRMFPTWSEVLEVLQRLGYEKVPKAEVREIVPGSDGSS